jgi:hypothetical protein
VDGPPRWTVEVDANANTTKNTRYRKKIALIELLSSTIQLTPAEVPHFGSLPHISIREV